MPKLNMEVSKIKGQGIYVQRVIDNLKQMKCELEALGCKVQIKVEGTELAGNGTRTRDILLGKNSVMVEGDSVATPQTENEVAE